MWKIKIHNQEVETGKKNIIGPLIIHKSFNIVYCKHGKIFKNVLTLYLETYICICMYIDIYTA